MTELLSMTWIKHTLEWVGDKWSRYLRGVTIFVTCFVVVTTCWAYMSTSPDVKPLFWRLNDWVHVDFEQTISDISVSYVQFIEYMTTIPNSGEAVVPRKRYSGLCIPPPYSKPLEASN